MNWITLKMLNNGNYEEETIPEGNIKGLKYQRTPKGLRRYFVEYIDPAGHEASLQVTRHQYQRIRKELKASQSTPPSQKSLD